MNETQFERMKTAVTEAMYQAVEPAIKTYVNGKIDKMNTKLDEHIIQHKDDIAEVQDTLHSLQSDISPLVRLFTSSKWLVIIVIGVLSVLANIGTIIRTLH